MLNEGDDDLTRSLALALTPDNREHRQRIKTFLQSSPLFAPRYDIPLASEVVTS